MCCSFQPSPVLTVHSFIPSLFLSISQMLVFTTPQTRTCRPLPRRVGGVTTRRPRPQTVGDVHPHELATCRPQQMSLRVNSPPTCNAQCNHHQGEPHTVQSQSPPGGATYSTIRITTRGSESAMRECNQCLFHTCVFVLRL